MLDYKTVNAKLNILDLDGFETPSTLKVPQTSIGFFFCLRYNRPTHGYHVRVFRCASAFCINYVTANRSSSFSLPKYSVTSTYNTYTSQKFTIND